VKSSHDFVPREVRAARQIYDFVPEEVRKDWTEFDENRASQATGRQPAAGKKWDPVAAARAKMTQANKPAPAVAAPAPKKFDAVAAARAQLSAVQRQNGVAQSRFGALLRGGIVGAMTWKPPK
jgi:hypothetical protein